MLTTAQIIAAARTHLGGAMESSAQSCLEDAEVLVLKGDEKHARDRARESLSYSVGVFHPVYVAACPHTLHERIADELDWSVEDTHGVSLPALRDLVQPVSTKLAREITEFMRTDGYVMQAGPR